MISTPYTPQTQAHAERAPTLNPTPDPNGIDPERYPILSRHWPDPPERAHRAELRLISSQSLPPTDDVVAAIDIERLAWSAYTEAVAAHDKHRSVATKRCRQAASAAWQRAFLMEHGEVMHIG